MIAFRKPLVVLLSTIIALCSLCFIGCGKNGGEDDDSLKFSYERKIDEVYSIGEEFSVPKAKIGGVVAKHTFVFPDGKSTNNDKVTLDSFGEYVINYSAVINGKTFTAEKTFSVFGPMFSVIGNGSIEYVEPSENASGILAKLKKGDRLRYNDVIDLNNFDRNMPFIKFATMPEVSGVAEANSINVIITDACDENNYLNISINKCNNGSEWDYKVSFFSVSFNGGKSVGLELSKDGTYETRDARDGKMHKYKAYVDSKYGTNMMFSMTGGLPNNVQTGRTTLGFMYDVAAQQMFITLSTAKSDTYYPMLCADLTMKELYGETFQGFTDGRVKVELVTGEMVKDTFRVFVASANGIAVEANNYNSYDTSVVPEIHIDTSVLSGNRIPDAKLGVPYEIFKASATDFFVGKTKVSVRVFFEDDGTEAVISDDSFIPDKVGNYILEYSAINAFGKKAVNKLTVKVIE